MIGRGTGVVNRWEGDGVMGDARGNMVVRGRV